MKQKDIYDEIAEAVGRKMGGNFVVELQEIVKAGDNKNTKLYQLMTTKPGEYSAGSEPLYPLERATLSAW